eukprot:GHVN01034590.1.p1 GENE.GHVN01034590.1~~GHVN01034590.1.p1  ORF type:complete len:622 (+),score=50.81 GHVN01034590.1:264-1868(+)
MSSITSLEKLTQLRAAMAARKVDAYIIPSEDAHNSEVCAVCDNRREFISSFTGTAGMCVVTDKLAGLWTDGRYFIQAEDQLPKEAGWKLHKVESGSISGELVVNWLNENCERGVVAFDPATLTCAFYDTLCRSFNGTVLPIDDNLIDQLWTKHGRPPRPTGPAFLHDEKYHNISTKTKLDGVKEAMKANRCGVLIVCELDEVAYLLNIRGTDIECSPLVFGYVVVTVENGVTVYMDDHKLTDEVKNYLTLNGITQFRPYSAVAGDLPSIIKANCSGGARGTRCWLDNRSNLHLYLVSRDAFIEQTKKDSKYSTDPEGCLYREWSPVAMMKAVKSAREVEGFRQCHVRDGVALSKYLCWLEELAAKDKLHEHDECTVADKLEDLRKEGELFNMLSFNSISSMGPNGALCHYRPLPGKCAQMTKGMYLIDSGGHYLDGTTDVTRTIHLSVPTDEQISIFTLVLKGHIQLARAVFPSTVSGPQLDVLARAPLWSAGLDYAHGTGHGVGYMLCVHEGPQGIGGRVTGKAARFVDEMAQ